MTRTSFRLSLALLVSLLLHIVPFVSELIIHPVAAPSPQPIRAEIRPARQLLSPLKLDTQLLVLRHQSKHKILSKTSRSKTNTPAWQREISRQLKKQRENKQLYPLEAIAQGLEGEVMILVFFDDNGQVAAARVEQSSGHRLLDDAALKAVYSLKPLPPDAPREMLLPVNFRLH